MSKALSEAEIQNRLYTWLNKKGHILSVPNLCLGAEADLISVTKTRMVHEYEIKSWRGDFLRELESIKFAQDGGWKGHLVSLDELAKDSEDFAMASRRAKRVSASKVGKHGQYQDAVSKGKVKSKHTFVPNFYWIVGLTGVVHEEDIVKLPPWVGVIEMSRNDSGIRVVRKPKLIHKDQISPERLIRVIRGVYYRYWATRLRRKVLDVKTSDC